MASEANATKAQTNDAILTVLFYAYAQKIQVEKIVFEDKLTTAHSLAGVTLRRRDLLADGRPEFRHTRNELFHRDALRQRISARDVLF